MTRSPDEKHRNAQARDRALTDKLDAAVARRVREAEEVGREQEIRVIVTCHPGTGHADVGEVPRAELERAGMKIDNVVESIAVASGTATSATVRALAELDEVERIEFDGEMHAL